MFITYKIYILIAKNGVTTNSNTYWNPNLYLATKKRWQGTIKKNVQNVLLKVGEIKCWVLENKSKIEWILPVLSRMVALCVLG